MSFFDHPDFWNPIWRRLLVVVVGLVWTYLEWHADSLILVGFAGLLTVTALYEFFLSGEYPKAGADTQNQH